MADSTLTSKGQVTVPKAIRDRLAVKPGDRISFTPLPDGTVLMRAKTRSITQLAAIFHEPGREPLPTDKLSF